MNQNNACEVSTGRNGINDNAVGDVVDICTCFIKTQTLHANKEVRWTLFLCLKPKLPINSV